MKDMVRIAVIESVWNLAFGGGEKKMNRKSVWLP
jgi:hypothetical protein